MQAAFFGSFQVLSLDFWVMANAAVSFVRKIAVFFALEIIPDGERPEQTQTIIPVTSTSDIAALSVSW